MGAYSRHTSTLRRHTVVSLPGQTRPSLTPSNFSDLKKPAFRTRMRSSLLSKGPGRGTCCTCEEEGAPEKYQKMKAQKVKLDPFSHPTKYRHLVQPNPCRMKLKDLPSLQQSWKQVAEPPSRGNLVFQAPNRSTAMLNLQGGVRI